MASNTSKKKAKKPKRHYDNFLDRDHSKDPAVLRKMELARKTLGDGSCLKEIIERHR